MNTENHSHQEVNGCIVDWLWQVYTPVATVVREAEEVGK